MKNNLKLLSLLICTSLGASSDLVQIDKSVQFSSHKLGTIDLYHDNGSFNVIHKNKFYRIENHAVDKPLRSLDSNQLAQFLKCGHISVVKTQSDNGKESFTLHGHIHGNGGGWMLGKIFKVVTYTSGVVGIAAGTALRIIPPGHVQEMLIALEHASNAAELAGEVVPGPL